MTARSVRAVRSWTALPAVAWSARGLALWLWRAPLLFQATLTSESVHAFQHLSFLGGAHRSLRLRIVSHDSGRLGCSRAGRAAAHRDRAPRVCGRDPSQYPGQSRSMDRAPTGHGSTHGDAGAGGQTLRRTRHRRVPLHAAIVTRRLRKRSARQKRRGRRLPLRPSDSGTAGSGIGQPPSRPTSRSVARSCSPAVYSARARRLRPVAEGRPPALISAERCAPRRSARPISVSSRHEAPP